MADKRIDELTPAESMSDDALLVVWQSGETKSVCGQLVASFAKESVGEEVKQAEAAKQAVMDLGVKSETLDAGSNATVKKTVDAAGAVTMTFGIPRGNTGATGPAGSPGNDGAPFTYDMFTDEQLAALTGPAGKDGNSIKSITRTSGTGAPGTTDTYTVTLTDGSTTTFYVYNGADGEGAGDMTAVVYDPQGKKTDFFKYVDDAVGNIDVDVTADEVTFADGETFQQKYDSGELTGPAGAAGKDGATFTPSVDAGGNLSWSNNGGMSNPATVNIKGPAGPAGPAGANTIASRHSVTLTTGGWSAGSGYAYTQTVSLGGVTADTDFDVDVNLSGTDAEADALILEAFVLVTFADSVSGGIKFACPSEKPGVNIPINIRIYG